MSITITFPPVVDQLSGPDRVARAVLPLLGAVLLSLAEDLLEDLIPGLGVALAVVKATGGQVSAS